MTGKVFFPQQPIKPVGTGKIENTVKTGTEGRTEFRQVLEKKLSGELKFSRHARERLFSRNIELTSTDLEKINDAVDKARAKGARDSLIIMDRLALVVSVKNNTVITAVDDESIKENVFTNIDSAVIL